MRKTSTKGNTACLSCETSYLSCSKGEWDEFIISKRTRIQALYTTHSESSLTSLARKDSSGLVFTLVDIPARTNVVSYNEVERVIRWIHLAETQRPSHTELSPVSSHDTLSGATSNIVTPEIGIQACRDQICPQKARYILLLQQSRCCDIP